jgi:OOP family OmpA-OmpF porin
MKKTFLMMAVALFAAQTMSAQTVEESKTFDNWYIGINGGVKAPSKGAKVLGNLNPEASLRIGRWFTPVWGVAVEGTAAFGMRPVHSDVLGTFVKYTNVSLLGTTNFTNWFGGYKGEPRTFELIGVYGLGWAHVYGTNNYRENILKVRGNYLSSKLGLDFTFNLGAAKAWQVYVEPNIVYNLKAADVAYNLNQSGFGLNVGVNYKFGNSNGTHNFKVATLRSQSEIDGLNAQINQLRADNDAKNSQLNDKDAKIRDLQNALDECNKKPKYVKPATATNLQPTVLFKQGKSTIDPAQYAPIELIASYMKNHPEANVEIKGYASPEGSAELNQKLSEARAEAVKTALVKKYKISADRLTTKGMGATDKLFEQVEFNRVATFNDNAK